MSRPRVVIAEPLHPEAVAWLRERADVVEAYKQDELTAALIDAEALIIRTYTTVDETMLADAPKLRVVARAGVGLDNIDLSACAAHGVRVVNTPEANTGAVVEFVLSAALSQLRPVDAVKNELTPENWAALRTAAITPRELSQCTLGIWGLGRIGKAVAKAMAPLAAKVVFYDLLDIPEKDRQGARPISVSELLHESDVLTLHVDGRAINRGLLGSEQFSQMKPDSIFINASRGFIVDAAALADHLHKHPSASAVLDVHDPEPIPANNPLLALPNATLTPHIGAATARAKQEMSWVVRPVWDALQS